MSGDSILQLLTGQWPDPETGALLGVPVRSIVIAESLDGIEGDLVARLDLGRRLAVVSDPLTHEVLGARVERAL
jgi:glycerol-1-phosphate dehydrogenase [NAD(P)+]